MAAKPKCESDADKSIEHTSSAEPRITSQPTLRFVSNSSTSSRPQSQTPIIFPACPSSKSFLICQQLSTKVSVSPTQSRTVLYANSQTRHLSTKDTFFRPTLQSACHPIWSISTKKNSLNHKSSNRRDGLDQTLPDSSAISSRLVAVLGVVWPLSWRGLSCSLSWLLSLDSSSSMSPRS